MLNLVRVNSKARKHYPAAPTKYQVRFAACSSQGYNSITVYRDERDGTTTRGTTFVIGDTCEQSSYNLSYHGKIVKITDKAIHVQKEYGGCLKRMSVEEFCWRNFDFNAAESTRKNHEEMMYL